jgi:hypothetical protein
MKETDEGEIMTTSQDYTKTELYAFGMKLKALGEVFMDENSTIKDIAEKSTAAGVHLAFMVVEDDEQEPHDQNAP